MIRAALAALLVPALLVGCGSDSSEPSSDAPVRTDHVELPKSYRFDPEAIEVDAGTTVTWENRDDFPHNVHLLAGEDVTKDLPIGGSATITFDEAGEFPYECSLHPQQMRGTVIVS